MSQQVVKLTRGRSVTVTIQNEVVSAIVLKTVTGFGYSVMTDYGKRRLVPASAISFN